MNRRKRYSPEVRERAVRLVEEQQKDHQSQWSAIPALDASLPLMPDTIQDTNQYANNRAEVPREPTRERARQRRRFNLIGHAQRCSAVHGSIRNLLVIPRHLMCAKHFRVFRAKAFEVYEQVTCV